jgi:hypothetical protein
MVRFGRVSVALEIGYAQENTKSEQADFADEKEVALGATSTIESATLQQDEKNDLDTMVLIKYLLGAFIALLAILVALRYFGSFFKESIVAVGRNPLAHSQVRSILIWNTMMIILIGGAGLLIGVVIILA